MPSNKNAAIRYRIIDRCLRNTMRPYPSKEYLREQISLQLFGEGGPEISLSSVEKDIVAMREDAALGYFAPIRYHRVHKGYYYEDPHYSIDGVGLNSEEADALRSAAQTLNLFADIPIFTHLKEAIEKINTRLSLSADINDPGIDKYVQFEMPVSSKGKEWLKTIYNAMVQRLPLTFTYHNIYKNETKEHTLDPYLLKEVRNKWYLVGYSTRYERFIIYALDRITALQTGHKPFRYRRDFNPEDFFKYSTGIMVEASDAPEAVELEAYGPVAHLLKLHPLHHSQQVVEEHANKMKLSLLVAINEELVIQLLGYSHAVKVLKPLHLQERMKQEIFKAMTLYHET